MKGETPEALALASGECWGFRLLQITQISSYSKSVLGTTPTVLLQQREKLGSRSLWNDRWAQGWRDRSCAGPPLQKQLNPGVIKAGKGDKTQTEPGHQSMAHPTILESSSTSSPLSQEICPGFTGFGFPGVFIEDPFGSLLGWILGFFFSCNQGFNKNPSAAFPAPLSPSVGTSKSFLLLLVRRRTRNGTKKYQE